MIHIRSPGRICLFGEHQDYLGLPTISMAISKYIYLDAQKIPAPKFIILMPNIEQTLEIPLNGKELEYESKRDYLKSGYNLFLRRGIKFTHGYRINITGDIPINAGAASSSAFVIAWLYFLSLLSQITIDKTKLAIDGYITEVEEFGEAGGKMDFFTTTYGNIIYLKTKNSMICLNEIPLKLKGFILANSLERKDTVDDLRRVKSMSIEAFNRLGDIMPNFSIFHSKIEDVNVYLPNLEKAYEKMIVGNIINRDITLKAKQLLENYKNQTEKKGIDKKSHSNFYKYLSTLINKHQEQLRDNIGISTQKINHMIKAALDAGALGAKINGSGFGGTMFSLAPDNGNEVINAIEEKGGLASAIQTSGGVGLY